VLPLAALRLLIGLDGPLAVRCACPPPEHCRRYRQRLSSRLPDDLGRLQADCTSAQAIALGGGQPTTPSSISRHCDSTGLRTP